MLKSEKREGRYVYFSAPFCSLILSRTRRRKRDDACSNLLERGSILERVSFKSTHRECIHLSDLFREEQTSTPSSLRSSSELNLFEGRQTSALPLLIGSMEARHMLLAVADTLLSVSRSMCHANARLCSQKSDRLYVRSLCTLKFSLECSFINFFTSLGHQSRN